MKTLALKQMENVQGGNAFEDCISSGFMGAIYLAGFGPYGMIGGFILGCGASQLG